MRYKLLLIITYIIFSMQSYAGYSVGNDIVELNTYGSLNSKMGGNFKYLFDDNTKILSEGSVNSGNDTYIGSLNSLYLSHQVSSNFKIKTGKLKLKDSLDYRYSIDDGKNLNEIYSDNKINDYDGISTLYTIKSKELPLKLNIQNIYGKSSPKSFGLGGVVESNISYEKIVGTNTSIISTYGKTRFSYIEIEPSANNPSYMISKGKLKSIGHKLDSKYFSNYSEYVQRSFEGVDRKVDSYYTSFLYSQHKLKPYTTYAQSIEQNGGTQRSISYGMDYSFMNNLKVKGEYKKIYSDHDYSGNFIETGIGVFNPNSYDDEIVSLGINLYY